MTNGEHTSTQFDIELGAVRDSVMKMGAIVREQFMLAMECLNSGNTALVSQTLDLGYQVNSLEVEIDKKCELILAKRQPEALDLRSVLTVLKITTDIERIGDQAELIVLRAEMLFHKGALNLPRLTNITRCANMALLMVDNSMESFSRWNVEIATQVIRGDKEVNDEYAFITRNLMSHMMENPRSIAAALDFLFVAKAIERIGDHAKNIAEYVIFMVNGQDVRHASIKEMEKISL